jgi:alpha-ketoglutaric semialdehyde dehydrogenase
MAGLAIRNPASEIGMPDGVFNLLHGRSNDVGEALVRHPAIQAVGFTGSLKRRRALFDLVTKRPQPIPVYAEMGSINPVVLLPGALAGRAEALARTVATAVTLSVGQFCTNPGLLMGLAGPELEEFAEELGSHLASTPLGPTLYGGICGAFRAGVERLLTSDGVDHASSPGQ